MFHPPTTLAGWNFSFLVFPVLIFYLFSVWYSYKFQVIVPLMLWIDLKTSPLSFHSAQGGAGELRLQRRADPPPAVLLQRRSGGAGWGGGDHQIRSAQPEAPQPTRHRHPAQAGGVHLRLWVRLTQTVGSSRHYLLLSLLEFVFHSPTWNTLCSLRKEPTAFLCVLVSQPLAHGWGFTPQCLFSKLETHFIHSKQQKFFPSVFFFFFMPLRLKCS